MLIKLLFTLVLLLSIGCYPVYAPPVRLTHYGAPEATSLGKTEIIISGQAVPGLAGVDGSLHYSLNDVVKLEFGVGSYPGGFIMGMSGVRLTPLKNKFNSPAWFTFDIELGGGLGVGGENGGCQDQDDDDEYCNSGWEGDDTSPLHRPAGGVYGGFGLGMNIKWFDLYARMRNQASFAVNVPATHWFTVLGGMQFTFKQKVKLFLASGFVQYKNEIDTEKAPFWEIGLGIHLGKKSPKQK